MTSQSASRISVSRSLNHRGIFQCVAKASARAALREKTAVTCASGTKRV